MYTVVDEVGKDRYWGTSLRDAFRVWSDIARRELDDRLEPDGSGNVMTDMDCGGGSQLYREIGDNYTLLHDSRCGRCWDCTDESESEPRITIDMSKPMIEIPLREQDE